MWTPARTAILLTVIAVAAACGGQDELVSGRLDVEQRPAEGDTILHLMVTFAECADGATPREIEDIQVDEDETTVDVEVLTWLPVPMFGGMHCGSSGWAPITVELDQPLGDRELRLHNGERLVGVDLEG